LSIKYCLQVSVDTWRFLLTIQENGYSEDRDQNTEIGVQRPDAGDRNQRPYSDAVFCFLTCVFWYIKYLSPIT
jgi:hypothetical protein